LRILQVVFSSNQRLHNPAHFLVAGRWRPYPDVPERIDILLSGATEILRKRFRRVAIVDIDVHHGNGTQEIFYGRKDILNVSLHADPAEFFPFFTGYSEEIGETFAGWVKKYSDEH
jgi:Histone deacetylase domain